VRSHTIGAAGAYEILLAKINRIPTRTHSLVPERKAGER